MLYIGIDFDNTLVRYDEVFYRIALEQGLIPANIPSSKTQIRDYLRSQKREEEWTRLQGCVYGAKMDLASPFPGLTLFFSECQKQKIKVSIISHKTRYPYLGPQYDLHKAARNWLQTQPFFKEGVSAFFELTLREKLRRIEREGCHFFIDDLPELLNETAFPQKTGKILFDPENLSKDHPTWRRVTSWDQMQQILPQLYC